MENAPGGEYIHGSSPDEQRRLSLLNDLMNETTLGGLALREGERVIDVGSGLGQIAIAAAQIVGPSGAVVGVERDPVQLKESRENGEEAGVAQRVDFRQGQATELPLCSDEWGRFDVAHARFLLEHVPDPQRVVDQMVRAVCPGGRIVLEDDDHELLRMWPEAPGVYDAWRAYIESMKKLGNDPYVGRKLVAILQSAGVQPTANRWNFFGSCAGNAAFAGFVENFWGVLRGARDTVLETTSFPREAFDAALGALDVWGKRPDAALWYCTFWATGEKPRA